jgi:AraC family transcriptional regulator of adaptative response/methylated-DNA-[protein]-cysteine methyltransferase
VAFFATPEEAAKAGFRAYKRCRPDVAHVTDPMVATIAQVCRRLEQPGYAGPVREIAEDFGYNERHLRRSFQEIVGVSLATYARAQQASRAREALQRGTSVSRAVVDAGYGSFRAFYEHGATTLGMSPNRFRSGGLGEEIRFTSVQTPRGVVVVACTPRGVCDVRIGDDEETLIAEMRAVFTRETVRRDDEGLVGVARALALGVDGDARAGELPLDVQGTAFQIRVWEALRRIPLGEVRSYAEVAQDIGAPTAVRAVASACGANRAAVVIPCHRVRRSDGSLGGYRWGVDVKAAILDAEARRR